MEWVEVSIGCAPELIKTVGGGFHAKRQQYALKPLGAITVHKAQGGTFPFGVAVEITTQYKPWEKGSIVVIFSRAKTAASTIIVHDGNINFVKNHIWNLITTPTQ